MSPTNSNTSREIRHSSAIRSSAASRSARMSGFAAGVSRPHAAKQGRAGADDQDREDVGTLGHLSSISSPHRHSPLLRSPPRGPRRAARAGRFFRVARRPCTGRSGHVGRCHSLARCAWAVAPGADFFDDRQPQVPARLPTPGRRGSRRLHPPAERHAVAHGEGIVRRPLHPHPQLGLIALQRRCDAGFGAGDAHAVVNRLHAAALAWSAMPPARRRAMGPRQRSDSRRTRQASASAARGSRSAASPDHLHELAEQILAVLRARARLGVILDAERRLVGQLQAAQAAVEQADWVGRALAGRLSASTAKPWFMLVISTGRRRGA